MDRGSDDEMEGASGPRDQRYHPQFANARTRMLGTRSYSQPAMHFDQDEEEVGDRRVHFNSEVAERHISEGNSQESSQEAIPPTAAGRGETKHSYSNPVFRVTDRDKRRGGSDWLERSSYYRTFERLHMSFGDLGELDGVTDDEEVAGTEKEPLIPQQKQRRLSLSGAENKTGNTATFLILLKGYVGTGILFLPRAFYQGGWLFSTLTYVIVAFYCTYNIILMIMCKHKVGRGGFGELAHRAYGPLMQFAVEFCIVFSQCGTVATYLIFISQNMWASLQGYMNCSETAMQLTPNTVLVFSLIAIVPLVMITRLKYFAIPSLLADVVVMVGLGWMYFFFFEQFVEHGPAPDLLAFNRSSCAVFIGQAIFAFEGIQLTLPIEDTMKDPRHFISMVIGVAIICATSFISFGALGYVEMGNSVDAVVMLSFPNTPWVNFLQMGYALSVVVSLPLQFYPACLILEQAAGFRSSPVNLTERGTLGRIRVVRVVVLLFLAAAAAAGSSAVSNFVAVTAGVSSIPVSFILPPLVYNKTCNPPPLRRWFHIGLSSFGVLLCLFTTYQSLATWSTVVPESWCPSPPIQVPHSPGHLAHTLKSG